MKRGFSLVEIIIGSAIIATSFVAIIGVNNYVLKNSLRHPYKTQSVYLAQEGIEALRIIRDRSYGTNIAPLSIGSTYYLHFNGITWISTTTPNLVDGVFTRNFILGDVYRDGNFNIANTGTLDSNSRLVTVNVMWRDENGTSTRQLQSYLFNTFNN
jgi:prepilin-type N-terminal cleavage/methylation domain-containing protein